MENENMVTKDPNEMTDEQLTAIGKLMIDIMCYAVKTIDWERAFDDLCANHEPEDYGLTIDDWNKIMEALSEDTGAEMDEIRNDGYYADLVKDILRGVIDHVKPCMDESQQLN